MTTADWAPAGSFTTIASIPGSYTTGTTSDGATIVTSGPYTGYTQTAHIQTQYGYTLGWESPVMQMAAPTGIAVSASTGVAPTDTQYALYGHIIPLLVLGRGRVGGDIISGPWVSSGAASGINSFGVQADPTRILTLIEIAFDSEVVWVGSCVGNAAGPVTPSSSGFKVEPFTCRFYTGSLTQSADSLETTNFGANAVAYRGQVLLAIENLPLSKTKFNRYPYISCRFVDQDGQAVNFGEAFERLAYSPYVGLTTDQFETIGITDGVADGGFIITQDTEFLQLVQQFKRFYPNWDILQTDKLRIVDRGSTTSADINLDIDRLSGTITTNRQGPDTVKKDLELSTIDLDADYTIVPSTAQRPRDPVAVTTSVGKDAAYLPVIMDAATRLSIVTFAKYHEEVARKTITGTAMAVAMEIEPGTLVAIRDLGDDFNNETFKIMETTHGPNYMVEFVAAAIMGCTIPNADPYLSYVVLLMGYTSYNDESPHHWGAADQLGSGALLSSSQAKFGSKSLSLDGASGIRFTSATATLSWLTFGAFPFTVEAFIYPNSVSGVEFIAGRWDGSFGLPTLSWVLYLSSGAVSLNISTAGTDNIAIVAGGVASLHSWQHIAADYDGTKYRVYLDGVCVGSTTATHTIYNPGLSTPTLSIGANNDGSGFRFSGFIDELRITNGVARYATDSSFVVPNARFPRF
ncbi:LamG domain-containing protein [Bradyrhizobium sp. PMVTL-01]|uniref:LamG domain-containing protein n=1 Tax=Bradyrhizobium sp. PMVTL-01 TaxID=3434999 RepID=UPI003F71ED04